jgi:hypothetical protein
VLSLEPPYWSVGGIPVFRDHLVDTQFYCGAPDPSIAVSGGRPMFDVFAYLVDLKHSPLAGTTIPAQMGAGFLTMGVECALPAGRRAAIVAAIASRTGLDPAQVSLAPVPYHRGSVHIIALDTMSAPATSPAPMDPGRPADGRPTFVESVLGSVTPNLTGDLRSIFSLSLSQAGVTFLRSLYEQHAAPVGIVYDLAYWGLRPAVQARVTADVATVYRHFGAKLGAGCGYFRAEIDAALDRLEQDGTIKVELTSQATGEEAQRSKELAMSVFKDSIVQQLFRPTAPAAPPGLIPGAPSSEASALVNLTLQAKRSDELRQVTYDFTERAPEERRHAPQAFLPLLVTEAQLASAIHRVDLHDRFFETLDVLVTGPSPEDFAGLGIRQATATLTYGQQDGGTRDTDGTARKALLFRADSTGDKVFGAARAGRPNLDYDLDVVYDLDRTAGVGGDSFRYELPTRRETSRAVLLNPNADFGFLDVELELGRVPDGLAELEVALSYGSPDDDFTAAQTFRLPAGGTGPNPHWRLRTREPDLAPYRVACTWHFADGTSWAQPAYSSTHRLLEPASPFRHERTLLIRPNVTSPAITEVAVEVAYLDEGNGYARTFRTAIGPPFAAQTLSWPVLDPSVDRVRYRVTTTEPGFVGESPWAETTDTSVVVGSVGARVGRIDVRLVGPALTDVGLDAARVDLRVEPPTAGGELTSLLLDDTTRSATASLTYPPGAPLRYRYRTTAFRADGRTTESAWVAAANTLLVLSTRNL